MKSFMLFAVVLFLYGSSALAKPAPQDMAMSTLAANAEFLKPPAAKIDIPKDAIGPSFYEFTYKNGSLVSNAEAINPKEARDPYDVKYMYENMTCTLNTSRPMMPGGFRLLAKPREELIVNTYGTGEDDEDETKLIKRAFRRITLSVEGIHGDRDNTFDKIVCVIAGDIPITVARFRSTISQLMGVELSAEQAAYFEYLEKLRRTMGKPVEKLPESSPKVMDSGGSKLVPAAPGAAGPKLLDSSVSQPVR